MDSTNGIKVGKKRVARLMREVWVCGVTRRKKGRTTIRAPKARPAPDLVEREFRAAEADQLWVAVITARVPVTNQLNSYFSRKHPSGFHTAPGREEESHPVV